jgi:hypothetical protein
MVIDRIICKLSALISLKEFAAVAIFASFAISMEQKLEIIKHNTIRYILPIRMGKFGRGLWHMLGNCFVHRCKVPQCFHLTVFTSLFGEHAKTGKTRFSVCPYCQVTAYFVNVLLGNTRMWETLKNVTPAYHGLHSHRSGFSRKDA